MKRWLKNSLISVTCLALVGFVVGFSTNWSHQTTITSVGSSGVKPFIEELSKDYMQQHSDIDITVDAGGSGFGIDQIADGFTNIGNASKDPYSTVNDEKNGLLDKWQNKRIKTYTVAWEAICLVYIPPKDIQDDSRLFPDDNNPLLSVSKDNIKNLYQAFSGFAEGSYTNKTPTLGDFVSPNSNLPEYIKSTLDQTDITPYVRTGGSLTSGTAASFYEYSRFDDPTSGLSDRTKRAFQVGNYGSDWKIVQTDEANSRAWDMFSKSNVPGSVVYLSSGFVAQNEELIKKNHYGVFGYVNKNDDITYSYSIDNMCDGHYDWCRPLNLMISLNNDTNEKSFIEDFLLDNTPDSDVWKKWRKMGAAPLSDTQKDTMKKSDGSYDISDTELGRDKYGAIYE